MHSLFSLKPYDLTCELVQDIHKKPREFVLVDMTTSTFFFCFLLVACAAAILVVHAAAIDWSDLEPAKPTKCPTGFFNFGDSLSDTGGFANAFPYASEAESLPYGSKFFGKPSKRFSNGRVIPDFFSLAFGQPLLSSYLQTSAFDYRHGVNFAVNGATASNDSTRVPFFLANQIAQFVRFKRASLSVKSQLACCSFESSLPEGNLFADALYIIAIGENDVNNGLGLNKTSEEIVNSIRPQSMQNFVNALKTLYAEGARSFLLFNIPPVGCSSIVLTLFGGQGLPTDSLGCIASINHLYQAYNSELNETITGVREALPNATISVFDLYNANIEILTNPAKYGFNPNKTLSACCGAPGMGNFNYNASSPCGRGNSTQCANPDEYLIWDGIHFTDSFYKQVSEWAMNGNFTDVPVNYRRYCGVDISKFDNTVTFDQVFGGSCTVQYT